jgi:hypothetical protein
LSDAELARALENILAIPVGVGQRRALVVNPAINAPADMLDEVPVNVGIDRAQTPFKVDLQGGLQRQFAWPAQGAGINPRKLLRRHAQPQRPRRPQEVPPGTTLGEFPRCSDHVASRVQCRTKGGFWLLFRVRFAFFALKNQFVLSVSKR